ncbi:MAG: hypothetical protein AAGF12_20110, partial [Myxococcota bacterium]
MTVLPPPLVVVYRRRPLGPERPELLPTFRNHKRFPLFGASRCLRVLVLWRSDRARPRTKTGDIMTTSENQTETPPEATPPVEAAEAT